MEPRVQSILFERDQVAKFKGYPFGLPAVRGLPERLPLHPQVTFLVGENGSGKSTLIEAIAIAAGMNASGGDASVRAPASSPLHERIRLARRRRERDRFFLRAESVFSLAHELDDLEKQPFLGNDYAAYGGKSLHSRSHGEAFLAIVENRLRGRGFYVFDEPEAALSPQRQLTLLIHIERLARAEDSQFVIATHSPILMAYPEATIYHLDEEGIRPVAYEETEHYQITRSFLEAPGRFLRQLFAPAEDDEACSEVSW